MIELDISICAISEPRNIPESTYWFGSNNGLAAIHWRPTNAAQVCSQVYRAQDFVVAKHGGINVIACYISPNCNNESFLTFLEELGVAIRFLDGRTLICGDFNSKSTQWGSPRTDRRGEWVGEWAAEHDLRLINVGSVPTCIRPQGWSIIDLTWATGDINGCINEWKVLSSVESLSDHDYIAMKVGRVSANRTKPRKNRFRYPRWNWNKLDEDMFHAAIDWHCANPPGEKRSADEMAQWINGVIRDVRVTRPPTESEGDPRKSRPIGGKRT
ncbi:uncharacterized protein LOC114944331 [Nylanderia fulva]|uniref:uncharacterized protein LOC114944331 n=1 Tax=Nylanderia fulva TaxID=613905 RepID=UPI0010FBABEC|nr:uncharacterized protein LOC114944331 [Nylanderia fulva]